MASLSAKNLPWQPCSVNFTLIIHKSFQNNFSFFWFCVLKKKVVYFNFNLNLNYHFSVITKLNKSEVLRDELENEMLPLIKVDELLVCNKKGQTRT